MSEANPEKKKLVMFDFDGVLVNTLEASYQIHKEVNKNFSRETFDAWHDGNFHEEYQKALGEGHTHPEDFGEKYQASLYSLTIHEILNAAVRTLSEKYILAVVSSTSSAYISKFLEKESLLSAFSDILGADVHKNKAVKINSLLEKYDLKSESAVYITDTLGDIREAQECDVSSIAVTWGQHSRESLERGQPAQIIDDPLGLVSTVEDVIK